MLTKKAPAAHHAGCACMACVTGQRNRFFKGKIMKVPEFRMEQRYGIERRRMVTRAIAGWGVVRGLKLEGASETESPYPEPREFTICPGLAVDQHGREILLAAPSVLGADNTFVVGINCELRSVEKLEPGTYILAIHYAERPVGDSLLPDDCCGIKTEKNYVCETALFSLRKLCPEDYPCGEDKCPERCSCHPHVCRHGDRSRNACLCEWVAKTEPPGCPEKPCRWRAYEVHINDGVDLARVHISRRAEECRPPLGLIQDDCRPRRIVKSNDLLYNLIRGCDLTRIERLSWGEWHRRETPVSWDDFIGKLKGKIENDVMETGLVVNFSGPVLAETVREDCFTLQFIFGVGWLRTRFVEITRVLKSTRYGDPLNTTRHAKLCVRPDWYEDLTCHGSKIRKEGAMVQIEVRGDFILDCHGQPVDADARGFALQEAGGSVAPGGNGTPGGVLTSVFKVARAHEPRPNSFGETPHLSDDEE